VAHIRVKEENERLKASMFIFENEIERYNNLNIVNEAKIEKLEESLNYKGVSYDKEIFVQYTN